MALTAREKANLRYASDPKFRSDTVKRVVKYQKKKQRLDADRESVSWRKMNIKVKGGSTMPVEACRIGFVAVAISRSMQTLRMWEKSKFIPKASIRFKGQRYYTKNQYNLFISLWDKHKGNLINFFNDLHKHWRF